jgi:hypothetical protein
MIQNNSNDTIGLIFSVFKSNESSNVNETRHLTVKEILNSRNVSYVDCIGSYEGIEEKSFLVVSRDLDLIQDLIDMALMEYSQDSVMLVEGQQSARLLFANGRSERIGNVVQVSEVEAKSFVGYTLRLDTMNYYTTTKTPKKQ